MEDSQNESKIPLKKVMIGTFETEEPEVLTIVDLEIQFVLRVHGGTEITIVIKQTDVAKVSINFGERNFVRLVLRPKIASRINEILPKGESYCFHSKDPQQSRFKLEFADQIDDLTKGLLQSFFEGVPQDNGDTTPMEVDGDRKAMKKKADKLEDGENIPPDVKKVKIDENPQPARTLRSRSKSKKPVVDYNPLDYASDDEQIQEVLRISSETVSKPPSRFDRFEHFENTIHLMTYRDIPLQMEDYKCLDRRELVTNFVLDFYLQYLYHEVLPEDIRRRVHIYKTHFYSLLATKANYQGWKDNRSTKAADKRYDRVKNLDSDVNIFERDFLVFPCNYNEHWFLAIACYPKLNGAVYADSGEPIQDEDERNRDGKNPTDGKPLKASCILIFDSVSTNPGRKTAAMNFIKNFLVSEYAAKYSADFPLESANIRTHAPKCPLQTNATDCGLFVLEFFEQFFMKAPVTDFRTPINLSNWFDPAIILEKREAIAEIFRNKIEEHLDPGQEMPMLPEISFSVESEEPEDGNGVCNGNENGDENGNNNNEEAFNNNNDFNAVDHNIQPGQEVPEISGNGNEAEPEMAEEIQENPIMFDTSAYSQDSDIFEISDDQDMSDEQENQGSQENSNNQVPRNRNSDSEIQKNMKIQKDSKIQENLKIQENSNIQEDQNLQEVPDIQNQKFHNDHDIQETTKLQSTTDKSDIQDMLEDPGNTKISELDVKIHSKPEATMRPMEDDGETVITLDSD